MPERAYRINVVLTEENSLLIGERFAAEISNITLAGIRLKVTGKLLTYRQTTSIIF